MVLKSSETIDSMEIIQAQARVARYLDNELHTPIIVDVSDRIGWEELKKFFSVPGQKIIEAKDLGSDPEYIPQVDKILQAVGTDTNPIMLVGLSAYLKLYGEDRLKSTLKSLLDVPVEKKLVILTYKCGSYLTFDDPRINAQHKVVLADAIADIESPYETRSLVFVNPKLAEFFDPHVDGVRDIPDIEPTPFENLHIITNRHKNDFPSSLFNIEEVRSAFDVIKEKYDGLSNIDPALGNEDLWHWLLNSLKKAGSWVKVVNKAFGGTDKLSAHADSLSSSKTKKEAWLYFIALKVHGAGDNQYLNIISREAKSTEDLKRLAYEKILSYEANDSKFDSLYDERKDLLEKIFGNSDSTELVNFLKLAKGKGVDGYKYLTDLTPKEKKEVISMIAENNENVDIKGLLKSLRKTFPGLCDYLSPFHLDDADKFEPYFNDYKVCKVLNIISPELSKIVTDQAEKREYNTIYSSRASIVSKLPSTKAIAYFLDALGVEFLSYIQHRAYDKGLKLSIKLGLANLPSITSINKEFIEDFNARGVKVKNVKDLDNLKHEGQGDYNYEHTKYPLHLVEELDVIDKVLNDANLDLENGEIDTVYIVSDHGASRLAVINETEHFHVLEKKGEHSGRCCPVSELSDKPECATEENGFWCLANYDRFKGGRKSSVEVHGGATLEEVVVPIITITKPGKRVECKIENPVITVSFKDKPRLTIYCSVKVKELAVLFNGKYYQAKEAHNDFRHEVEMDTRMSEGEHFIDVYADGTLIAQGLKFTVKKKGSSERKFF